MPPTRRTLPVPTQGDNSPGPGIDARGNPVVDPTQNVLLIVQAAVQRQDDLRDQENIHVREMTTLRAGYEDKLRTQDASHADDLRQQEAARIDAIRAVDVAATARAAEVAAAQQAMLAAQVAATAEAMRVQVAAAAAAAAESLSNALKPIQESINDLRKSQYELQGQKSANIEGKESNQWAVMATISAVGIVLVIVQVILHFVK